MKQVLMDDFEALCGAELPFENYKEKTFLITGATGLIGSLLVRSLLYMNDKLGLGLKVKAVIRNRAKAEGIYGELLADPALSLVVADLEKDGLSLEGPADYIVHAAAVTASREMVSNPVGTIWTAIDGTRKVLDLAVEKGSEAVIYISSMEVYGQPNNTGKTGEMDLGQVDITTVRSCYPEGKRMCECLCTAYAAQYNVNVKSARLAQTFGAGILPGENRVFAQFARSAMEGRDIVLHTTGESEGNYVYTVDALKGILMLLHKGKAGEAYNIVNEASHTTIRDMAKLVSEEIAGGQIKTVIDIPEDTKALGYAPPVRMHLSSARMNMLGWEPTVGLKEAYLRTIEWLK